MSIYDRKAEFLNKICKFYKFVDKNYRRKITQRISILETQELYNLIKMLIKMWKI